jgi:SsrA-binding protein
MKITNTKARFDYEFLQTEEAGVVLSGRDVKDIRMGSARLQEAFCLFNGDELFIYNLNIGNRSNVRKLLLKRKELNKLQSQLIKGLTIIPYQLYTNEHNLFKIEIALAKGKKNYDKRESIKLKDLQRELQRKVK